MFGKINDAYESVKNGLEAQIALATAEEKERLADAKLALADLKMYIADLKEENQVLATKLKTKDEVIYDDEGIAWVSGMPHCGGCLGSKDKKVVLRYYNGNLYQCPACQQYYGSQDEPRKGAPLKTPK